MKQATGVDISGGATSTASRLRDPAARVDHASLLLFLDADPHADSRDGTAIELALRHGAHLHGLACHTDVPAGPEFAVAPGGPNDPVRRDLEEARRQAGERTRRFARACARRPPVSFETSLDDSGQPVHAILRRAVLHDLVLLGQPDPLDPEAPARQAIVEEVVLRNPRPTLLLPHAGDFSHFGRTALVAWDGSAGAARAVSDALPLLATCRDVLVVQFEDAPPRFAASGPAPLAAVERWLRRHGIEARSRLRSAEDDIGVALLSHAIDVRADLLVMGGWGHARWRERLLGGVTRTVLQNMAPPVLISH